MSHTLRDDGLMTWTEKGTDRPYLELGTLQCVHCGNQFPKKSELSTQAKKLLTPFEAAVMEQQGKTVRGFCLRCNGPICGPNCVECVPEEQLLENLEHGREMSFRPVVSSTSRAKSWFEAS